MVFPLALSLALGEAAALFLPVMAGFWPWALVLTVLVILFGYGWEVSLWGYAATALLGFSVASSHLADRRQLLGLTAGGRGPFVCEVVLREDPRPRGDWYSVEVAASGQDLRVVFPSEDVRPRAGDVWRFVGWLERKPLTDFTRRKLWVKGTGSEARRLRAAGPWSAWTLFARVRADLSRRLGIGLGHAPGVANLNRAILLGERRGLDFETRNVFAAAGTTHVFAISGLHVMCVAGILFAIAVVCGVPVRWTGVALIPILWCYVVLVGAAPSAIRAAAMATLYFFAPVFWRKSSGLVVWSLVFIAVHLLHPLQIADVGSCLSFAVMLTLILFGRWYREVVPSRRGEVLAISCATWAAGVPIVAVVFGRFTPGAIFANLFLLPVAGLSVFASALAVGASFVSSALASVLNNAAALATSVMVGVSRLVAAVPCASAEVSPWTLWQCAAWYLVLVLSLYLIRSVVLRRRRGL